MQLSNLESVIKPFFLVIHHFTRLYNPFKLIVSNLTCFAAYPCTLLNSKHFNLIK